MNLELPRIYLVRHGETAWTLTGQHTGRTDLPLTEEGERQARELAPGLTRLPIDRIFSSPLQRARRTAELAMPHSRVEADDDLMEWDYGAYEGRRTTEIEVDRPGWRLFRDGCPNGETLDSVGKRADRVIGRIRAERGSVLLFGHREILRILAVRWIELSPIEGRHLSFATASLSVLGYDHDLTEPVIHVWNGDVTTAASAPLNRTSQEPDWRSRSPHRSAPSRGAEALRRGRISAHEVERPIIEERLAHSRVRKASALCGWMIGVRLLRRSSRA